MAQETTKVSMAVEGSAKIRFGNMEQLSNYKNCFSYSPKTHSKPSLHAQGPRWTVFWVLPISVSLLTTFSYSPKSCLSWLSYLEVVISSGLTVLDKIGKLNNVIDQPRNRNWIHFSTKSTNLDILKPVLQSWKTEIEQTQIVSSELNNIIQALCVQVCTSMVACLPEVS